MLASDGVLRRPCPLAGLPNCCVPSHTQATICNQIDEELIRLCILKCSEKVNFSGPKIYFSKFLVTFEIIHLAISDLARGRGKIATGLARSK
jgi:hypothetical protein